MSVLKYKDPVTGEVKIVGSPSMEGVAKEATLVELQEEVTHLAKEVTLESLQEEVNNLAIKLNNIPTGLVKRIQSGVTSVYHNSASNVSLTGFTDLSKMIVLINGTTYQSSDSSLSIGVYVKQLTLSQLTLQPSCSPLSHGGQGTVSYQVIEFY